MKKVFSEWVPHLLTIDNSESYLALFTRNKQDFLSQFVTMEKTWIHYFTLELNQQSVVMSIYQYDIDISIFLKYRFIGIWKQM